MLDWLEFCDETALLSRFDSSYTVVCATQQRCKGGGQGNRARTTLDLTAAAHLLLADALAKRDDVLRHRVVRRLRTDRTERKAN